MTNITRVKVRANELKFPFRSENQNSELEKVFSLENKTSSYFFNFFKIRRKGGRISLSPKLRNNNFFKKAIFSEKMAKKIFEAQDHFWEMASSCGQK